LPKKYDGQGVPFKLKVPCDIGKDCAKRADSKLLMGGDRNVVLCPLSAGSKANVAAGLSCNFVAVKAK
jgi:hypothetical protein